MLNKNVPVITLDGPSGTGKGTLCHRLAKSLGWHILDSGSIYRALALAAFNRKIDFNNVDKLVELAFCLNLKFMTVGDFDVAVFLDSQDVSSEIRMEEIGDRASQIAVVPAIREALLARQRAFAKPPGLVTDGRDMGTVVFPDAFLKIYLYATPEERAKRRYLQLQEKGVSLSLEQVLKDLALRDKRDMERSSSPLKPAEDAVLVDTTGLSIAQVLESILQLTRKKFIE